MAANRFELLATQYLRFNGYFTIQDFTVHPDFRKQPGGTDADILAVRFPYSEEFQLRYNFERDTDLILPDRMDFLICEVKTGCCDINQKTWRNTDRKNVEYAIRWMGFESDNDKINEWAAQIYGKGECDLPEEHKCIRFISFGKLENRELMEKLPSVQQIYHSRVFDFLRKRFCLECLNITRENWDKDIIDFAAISKNLSNDELFEWAKLAIGQLQL